jgi:hypothetical protein
MSHVSYLIDKIFAFVRRKTPKSRRPANTLMLANSSIAAAKKQDFGMSPLAALQ